MSDELQPVFRALADPTRRQILMDLSAQEMTIAEVADQFQITRGAVKKHLVILEQGGLISVHTNGRERVNQFEPDALHAAQQWLNYFAQFWDNRLASLKKSVEKPGRNKRKKR
jgi:DNA-binding transcriptional ArsR family regulator